MVKPNKGDFKFPLCEREWLAVEQNAHLEVSVLLVASLKSCIEWEKVASRWIAGLAQKLAWPLLLLLLTFKATVLLGHAHQNPNVNQIVRKIYKVVKYNGVSSGQSKLKIIYLKF